MYKLCLFMITTFLYSNIAVPKQARELTWGYVNFAPYHYSENGIVTGVIADQLNEIFKNSNLSYSAVELPNKRTKLYIEQGRVDFSTVIESFITNSDYFLKSDLPIYNIVLGAVCLADSYKINNLEDLKPLRLILLSGYTYGTRKQLNEENGFNIELKAQNHYSAIKALQYKRADCVLAYQSPTLVETEKYPNLELTFYKINEFPVYLFLNKQVENSQSVMEIINKHIR